MERLMKLGLLVARWLPSGNGAVFDAPGHGLP
jgi:hypothetical protein